MVAYRIRALLCKEFSKRAFVAVFDYRGRLYKRFEVFGTFPGTLTYMVKIHEGRGPPKTPTFFSKKKKIQKNFQKTSCSVRGNATLSDPQYATGSV